MDSSRLSLEKVLVTGACGFVGLHTCIQLIENGYQVIASDRALAESPEIQSHRYQQLTKYFGEKLKFRFANLANDDAVTEIWEEGISYVIHLAAKAGVTPSMYCPEDYVSDNIKGFFNLINFSMKSSVKHFIFASSSSVYGRGSICPFKESEKCNDPNSFYAATKKCDEILANALCHQYKIPVTALRFFTVYGPWGRPDMAVYKFTEKIINGQELKVYNNGKSRRAYTYISDVVAGIILAMNYHEHSINETPFQIFNIGSNECISTNELIGMIEKCLSMKAQVKMQPLNLCDMSETEADLTKVEAYLGYKPRINIQQGIKLFVNWYLKYVQN